MRAIGILGGAFLIAVLLAPDVRADEIARKIRSAIGDVEGAVVSVKYTRDVGSFAGFNRLRGRRGGAFFNRLGEPSEAAGIVTNDRGFVAVSADIAQNPFQGWGESDAATVDFKEIGIVLPDGEERPARIVGRDSTLNLLFVQLDDPSGLAPVSLAATEKVELGDQVIVIAPLAQENSTPKFLLTRINSITEGDAPSYGLMDDVTGYDGAVVSTLDGDAIGVVGRPASTRTEEDVPFIRRWIGGRSTDLRVIPASRLTSIFADPPTGLLVEEEPADDQPLTGPRNPEGSEDEEEGEDEEEDY